MSPAREPFDSWRARLLEAATAGMRPAEVRARMGLELVPAGVSTPDVGSLRTLSDGREQVWTGSAWITIEPARGDLVTAADWNDALAPTLNVAFGPWPAESAQALQQAAAQAGVAFDQMAAAISTLAPAYNEAFAAAAGHAEPDPVFDVDRSQFTAPSAKHTICGFPVVLNPLVARGSAFLVNLDAGKSTLVMHPQDAVNHDSMRRALEDAIKNTGAGVAGVSRPAGDAAERPPAPMRGIDLAREM